MPLAPDNPNNRSVASILLREGGVIAFPTDTVYGLGASAFNHAAVSMIFVIKNRSRDQGLPVLIASESQLPEVASEVPDSAYALAERFWPGGLTLVVPRNTNVPALVAGYGDTIAVRLPDHPCPQTLVQALGKPITGTSANRHNGPEPSSAVEVQRQLGNRLSMILDGGESPVAVPSTIVDTTQNPPKVLRPGGITLEQMRDVCEVAGPDAPAC